ncbi:uncharacterized protein LOC127094363 [Lathyrus oleraceus]|uniref:uncharacterized protein LOC127094363 n=1 Tax=Pisum sativum TaxID=3888 RepID=UPI0021D2A20D|nr:uncharacterized protein LOC127094363 [Pisum sativum]
MGLDRDQLRAMSHKDKETFKEYVQRWCEITAQVSPLLKEKEMTKLFLKTLSPLYYKGMVASAPSYFTEMVNMGLRLEEGVRERWLKEGSSFDGSKRYGNGLPKKKEHDATAISQERHRRLPRNSQRHQHVACKNLVQTRTPPTVPKELLWWYKADQHCGFHQGAPGHDIENCFSLKDEVRRLMQSGILSFEDSNPNVQVNSLPKHGNATMNMVEGCPGKYRVFNVNLIKRSLVEMQATLCELTYYEHDRASCQVCSGDPRGCVVVKRDLQEMLDQKLIQVMRDRNEDEHEKTVVSLLVIRLVSPTPYESDKAVPYKYNATMVEYVKEVPILTFPSVVNIVDVSGVTRSGRISVAAAPKRTKDVVIEK